MSCTVTYSGRRYAMGADYLTVGFDVGFGEGRNDGVAAGLAVGDFVGTPLTRDM
jgi:hypothetical protein